MSTPAAVTRGSRPARATPAVPNADRPATDPCPGALRWHGDLRTRAVLIITHQGQKVLGPRFVRLLREIEARGSIRRATRELGLGYRHAIAWIQRAEIALERPLVTRHAGGGRAGGASLTSEGRELIAAYQRVADRVTDVLADAEALFFPGAPDSGKGAARAPAVRRTSPRRAR